MEHRLVTGGEHWLAFARSRVKVLRAAGLAYAGQQYEMPDGASVKVRIIPGHEYLTLSGGPADWGIVVQLEKASFDNGASRADAWEGAGTALDGVRSLTLPGTAKGTKTRSAKLGIEPQDLLIQIDPDATLGPGSLTDGRIKIRRILAQRGDLTDLNYGQTGDGETVKPRTLMSMDFAANKLFHNGAELALVPPLAGLGGLFIFSTASLVFIGLIGDTFEIHVARRSAKLATDWHRLHSGTKEDALSRYYSLSRSAPGEPVQYTVRTTPGTLGEFVGPTAINGSTRDTTITISIPADLAELSGITASVNCAKFDADTQATETTATHTITVTVDEVPIEDGTLRTVSTTLSRSAELKTPDGEVLASWARTFTNTTTYEQRPLFSLTTLVEQTASEQMSGSFPLKTVSASGPLTHTTPPQAVVGDFSEDVSSEVVLQDVHTGAARLTLALDYERSLTIIGGTVGTASTAMAAPTLAIELQRPLSDTKEVLSQDLYAACDPPAEDSLGREGSAAIRLVQITTDTGRGYWSVDGSGTPTAFPFPVFPAVTAISTQEQFDAVAGFSHSVTYDGEVIDTAQYLTNFGDEVDAAFLSMDGTADGEKYPSFKHMAAPDGALSASPLTEFSSFPEPSHIIESAGLAYDPRTKGFFAHAAIAAQGQGATVSTHANVMLIGNQQGHTPFLPILNEWLASIHAQADDGITETYADDELIVGLNLAKPGLI